jgi:hypothetical protein
MEKKIYNKKQCFTYSLSKTTFMTLRYPWRPVSCSSWYIATFRYLCGRHRRWWSEMSATTYINSPSTPLAKRGWFHHHPYPHSTEAGFLCDTSHRLILKISTTGEEWGRSCVCSWFIWRWVCWRNGRKPVISLFTYWTRHTECPYFCVPHMPRWR